MATAGDDPITAREAPGAAPSRFGGLLRLAGFAALAIIVLAGLWYFRAGQLFLNDAHRRNMNALSVAANGLQYWPDSVRNIALAQLVSTNVHRATPRQMLEGWDLAARVKNPDLGQFEVLYAFVGTGVHHTDPSRRVYSSCEELQGSIEHDVGTLPFVNSRQAGGGPMVKVFGETSLAEPRSLDFTRLRPDIMPDEDMASVITRAGLRSLPTTSDVKLCFGAEVQTKTLLRLDETRDDSFSNFLVVDGAKHVAQQLGEDTLPVDELGKLRAMDESLSTMLATSEGQQPPPKDEKELSQAVGPETLQVAGRFYIAYVQPFRLPTGLRGCSGRTATTAPATRPDTGGATASQPETCYLVGLVPRARLWGDAARPAPLFILTLALINGLLLCAFPIARLLLLGRNESLPRYNTALIVGGAIIGMSLITIALLTWVDITFERQRIAARAEFDTIMISMVAGEQLRGLIEQGLANREGMHEKQNLGNVTSEHDAERVQLTPDPLGGDFAKFGDTVEGAETVFHLAANGRPVACQVPAVSTHDTASNRFEVLGRAYYVRFRAGEFTDVFYPRDPRISPVGLHYVVDQVRSQTDGVNKAVILIEAPDPGHTVPRYAQDAKPPKPPKHRPCETAGYLIGGVIGSLLSPPLPSGFEMATVDTNDPALPVKFHSRPERIGVEQLAREIGPRAQQQLNDWIRYSPISETSASDTYNFTAMNYGTKRQFFASRIAHTPWLVTVSYSLADVDQLPVTRAERAIVSGLTLALALLLVWWVSARIYPGIARNLWPHEKIELENPDRRLIGAMSYGVVALLLGALMLGEALALSALGGARVIYVIAVLATLAVALLYVQSHAAPRLFGALSPANERAFRNLSIVFLCCIAILPTFAIWRDAAVDTDAQERLQAAVQMNGANAEHRNALDLVARSWFPPSATATEPAKRTSSAIPESPDSFYAKWFKERLDHSIPTSVDESARLDWDFRRKAPGTFLFAALILLVVLGWALWRLLGASLNALFGFGAPLGIDARRRHRFDPLYPLRNASPLVEKYLAEQVNLPPDAKKAFSLLVRETVPLPANIIFHVLANDAKDGPSPPPNDLPGPVDDDADQHASFQVVRAWAWRVDAPSRVEALNYLGGLLERYYRSLWDGQSLPERLALDHIARRRIINVGRAAPVIASLLRQGLIVLDPAPRLMNESFAAFVRQAEQSSTIRTWARRLGTRSNSRLLLLVGAPALTVSVGLILLWTGTDPSKILPIFATGIPALIAVLQKLTQQNTH